MAAPSGEGCVTAWPPSWGSDNASPPPSTVSGLRTDGGRLSPFCLRTWRWPTPATWWQNHLWLRYGTWADELASGLQVGARITFDAVVTRYVKGYTGDDPVRQAARPRELDYGLEKIQSVPWPRPRWAWVNCPDFALSSLCAGGTAMPRKQLNIGLTPAQYEAVRIAAEAEGQKHCYGRSEGSRGLNSLRNGTCANRGVAGSG